MGKGVQVKEIYVTIYTKENGKEELNQRECQEMMSLGVLTYHRTDGPAYEDVDQHRTWWVYGKRHRTDGPAIESDTGHEFWYIEGKEFEKDDYDNLIKEVRDMSLALRLVDPRRWVREFE